MKQIKLTVSNRDQLGGRTSDRYRKANKIPAVIYGESGVKHLLVDTKAFAATSKAISGIAALLEVFFEDGTDSRYAMVKTVERDPINDSVLHIDFKEVVRGKPMHTVVPLHITGESFGVKTEGGVLETHLHEVKIKCRPRDLPETIVVDVTDVKVGDSIHLKQLKLPAGVELDMDGDRLAISCALSKSSVAEEAAAPAEGAAAAPAAAPAAESK